MGSERVRPTRELGVRRVVGGLTVEITRHGKGFRVYGVQIKRTPKGDRVQYRRLPGSVEREILAGYGSPHGGA